VGRHRAYVCAPARTPIDIASDFGARGLRSRSVFVRLQCPSLMWLYRWARLTEGSVRLRGFRTVRGESRRTIAKQCSRSENKRGLTVDRFAREMNRAAPQARDEAQHVAPLVVPDALRPGAAHRPGTGIHNEGLCEGWEIEKKWLVFVLPFESESCRHAARSRSRVRSLALWIPTEESPRRHGHIT
jgi:hypothetical protein